MSEKKEGAKQNDGGKRNERKRVFGRDEREALETQRRATAYGRARGLA